MKAAVYTNYGPPEVVKVADVEKPVPKDDEVLIKVRAASVNPLDWRIIKGKPFAVRVMASLTKMKGHPGVDAAGEVEAVGKNVTQFKPGDAVFGACRAAFAEYTCGSQAKIAMKPDNVTFEQAASINVAGLTALQGLRDHGKIKKGSKLLVNGAAGGVGTFAVQIGKWFGAHVTGVCSTKNIELVRSIGADDVIDYTQNDFTSSNQRYDLILDCVGNHSFSACRRVLSPEGKVVIIGGPHDPSVMEILAPLIKALWSSLFGRQKAVPFIAKASQADLTILGDLVATGKVKPVIESVYSLSDSSKAIRHVEEGHARGKVIITLDGAREA
jgi:NADPH:quinone reductase-like Zn-dependent oxidoreductase